MRSGSERRRPPPRPRGRLVARAVAAFALLCSGACAADSLFVICNPAVTLSQRDLRGVFLGEKEFSGRIRLAPVDNRQAQAIFLDRILMMTAARYSTSWIKKSFRDGVNPLPVKGSDAETTAYVRSTKGGCGYVTKEPGPGVTIIVTLTT